ncbi:uridine kinase family protein [Cellulosilyticum sp. I15G10I2]|uniref:uridine kinase family protein n=1 Tax=Cellulosilyticum sp. I15G10I2 TaxID=1892843 RepID=UPI00085C3968|nr:hypothetical protein [Cellulosilyticum sp. I15G10I2]
MKELLLRHISKYPHLEIQDLVKLIYQNEFAGEHMILDEKSSLERLQKEWETSSEVSSFDMDLFEDIGSGLCRLHLAPLKHCTLSLETLNRLFIYTANTIKGTVSSFEGKLNTLLSCCKTEEIPFSYIEVKGYLDDYKNQGYPPTHHSNTFRQYYNPSYRIVKKEFADYLNLFCAIDTLVKDRLAVTIGIDGNSGSGKSTLAALLGGIYKCNLFHMDDFFLRPEQKTKERLAEIGGNVDYVRFKEEVANQLDKKQTFTYQIYDCSIGQLTEYVTVHPKNINIIEGVYSLHPFLCEMYQLKVFMSIDADSQSRRILQRSGPRLHQRFVAEWIPLENAYFTAMQIEQSADLVFRTND